MTGSRVFVGGLPRSARQQDLKMFFEGFGRLCDIIIKPGFGYVEFENHRDADNAIYEMNGKCLMGEKVSVQQARARPRGERSDNHRKVSRYGPPRRSEYRVIVENLSSRVSWQDLKDYLRKAGEVIYVDAHSLRKNEGVAEFESRRDMERAIRRLDDTELNDRRIRLRKSCVERRKREHSRSFDSRSRTSSRSSYSSHSRSDYRYRSPEESRYREVPQVQKRYRDESRSPSRSTDDSQPRKRRCYQSPREMGHQAHQISKDRQSRSSSRSQSDPRSRSRLRSEDSEFRSRSRSRSRSYSCGQPRLPYKRPPSPEAEDTNHSVTETEKQC